MVKQTSPVPASGTKWNAGWNLSIAIFVIAIFFLLVAPGCSDSNSESKADAGNDDPSGSVAEMPASDAGVPSDGGIAAADAADPASGAPDAALGAPDAAPDAPDAGLQIDAGPPPPPPPPPPVTFDAVHAIFTNKCAPCHTTLGSGDHNMGAANINQAYADSQLAATTSNGTKGAAALLRIQNGSMPFGAGCSGNPTTDSGNASCLTQSEQNTLQAWISAGQLPPL